MRTRSALPCALLLAAAACSEDPAVLTLDITPGYELDAFSRDPAVTRVDVRGASPEGDVAVAASSTPGGTFELGDVPEDRLLEFDVTGYDAGGSAVVRGRSLGFVVGAVAGDLLPIFAQRSDAWARPPSALTHSHVGGVAGTLGERFLLLTGGQTIPAESDLGSADPAYYDLLLLTGAAGSTLPRRTRSLLLGADGVTALLVDDEGATWVDYDHGTSSAVVLPPGLGSFADVAGGRSVTAPDGTLYLVGATRPEGPPTKAVLVWPPGRELTVAELAHERQAAAAVWLADVGLAVAAGSDTAPGLEVLATGAAVGAVRSFPADPTVGAAAVERGSGQLVLVGGYDTAGPAPTRLLDSGCVTECLPTPLDIPVPARLGACQAFAADADRLLLVGQDVDDTVMLGSEAFGLTRTFTVDVVAAMATEQELREPRAGAAAWPTPHGLLALLGGLHRDGTGALTVELRVPSVR